jgi:hypothetical protein
VSSGFFSHENRGGFRGAGRRKKKEIKTKEKKIIKKKF